MKTLEFLRQNREKIYEIASKYGISNIRVFGSVARGQDNENSDIDFLINQNSEVSLFEIADFKHDLENFLNKKTDIITDDGINKRLEKIIHLESVLV